MRIVGGVIVRAALCGLALAAIPWRSTTAAEVAKIGPEHARRLPGGKEVDAIHGDYLLRSDRIVATIGGVGAIREANVNTQAVQGAVLDLARRDLPGGEVDLLTAFYPHGHYLDEPGPTRVRVIRDRGAAVVRFARDAVAGMQGDPVDVETEYTVRDGEPFLRSGPRTAIAGRKPPARRSTTRSAPTPCSASPRATPARSSTTSPGMAPPTAWCAAAPDPVVRQPGPGDYFLQGGNRLISRTCWPRTPARSRWAVAADPLADPRRGRADGGAVPDPGATSRGRPGGGRRDPGRGGDAGPGA
ncbi:MAG: hypothetical protein WKF75_01940 [Singulisphaera sp.]